MRLQALSCTLFLLAASSAGVSAQDTFDCKVTLGENKWDLTSLAGEQTLSRERNTPPTKFQDIVTFNLCEELTRKEGVADKDQVSTLRIGTCGKYFEPHGSESRFLGTVFCCLVSIRYKSMSDENKSQRE